MRWMPPLLLALLVAGCNTTSPPAPDAAAKPELTQQGLDATPANGCAGHIARYRAVIENDKAMGHVADTVYNQISGEIAAAEKECTAGHDAQAEAAVRASEARHGYPTSI